MLYRERDMGEIQDKGCTREREELTSCDQRGFIIAAIKMIPGLRSQSQERCKDAGIQTHAPLHRRLAAY